MMSAPKRECLLLSTVRKYEQREHTFLVPSYERCFVLMFRESMGDSNFYRIIRTRSNTAEGKQKERQIQSDCDTFFPFLSPSLLFPLSVSVSLLFPSPQK